MKDNIEKAIKHQLGLQSNEGYWWYTLEANESICAEAVFLMHFLGEVDLQVQSGLAKRILSTQRLDGTWALYHGGPPDLSTTIECYWALKLARHCEGAQATEAIPRTQLSSGDCRAASRLAMTHSLNKTRDFILSAGGITNARVFTKIHLAQFGLAPWEASPAMPAWLMLLPNWFAINVYEFSSWARACIIPLLVVLNKKPVRSLGVVFDLNELFTEPPEERDWKFQTNRSFFSWERLFIGLDKILKFIPSNGFGINECEKWICQHIEKTEDIFPALAYGAIALSSLGHPNSHPIIRKALNALKSFQQVYGGDDLPANACTGLVKNVQMQGRMPRRDAGVLEKYVEEPPRQTTPQMGIFHQSRHQQCCISPVWDTPWQVTALLDSGVSPDDPQLLKAGQWLISKEITSTRGDWRHKNPRPKPSGWSFEFENEYFPDVDDTIQVLHVLHSLALPESEKRPSIERGLKWLISMQNKDGGWGAFDKDQRLLLVNKIPFSDHGACLDPSSPDITGRAIALLSELSTPSDSPLQRGRNINSPLLCKEGLGEVDRVFNKALSYLSRTQEEFGGWFGRWGVNYIYGTWCVLTGLAGLAGLASARGGCAFGAGSEWLSRIQKATDWLISIQHEDGGWSESPESYKLGRYEPYPREILKGVPSQTAWAVMALMAAKKILDHRGNDSINKGIEFLLKNQKQDGTWDESEFTGTGFPGHFYIRYHGYRHFFPLLALAKFRSL